MTRLDYYIGRYVIGGTLLVLLVLLGVDVFFAFVGEIDNLGQGRYGLGSAFYYLLLTIPSRIVQLFPMCALLGSLLGLGVLAGNHELVAFRAAGVSLLRITRAVLTSGVLMVAVIAALGEFVAPQAEQAAHFHRELARTNQAAFRGQYGFWARDGQRYISIREILPGGRLRGVFVYELGPDQRMVSAMRAEQATFTDGQWQLDRVRESSIGEDYVRTRSKRKLVQQALLDPDLLDVVIASPDELSARDLDRYIGYLDDNGLESDRYQLAYWGKLAAPLAGLVMLVLSVPFVLGILRDAGNSQRVLFGILVGLGFYLFNQTALYMGAVFSLQPLLAAFTPPLIFLLVAVLALRRLGRP